MSLFLALYVCGLLAQVVFGVCPNNCNSHGTCTANGVCNCYHQSVTEQNTQPGDVLGYTGADCSQGIYYISYILLII